jgi:hypothetical protein
MSVLRIEYSTVAGDDDLSEQVQPDRLVQEIERIRQQFEDGLDPPYGVDVVNGRGDRMTVGFDEREGFLMYQPGSDQEWTRYSMGDPKRDETKVFYLPRWTELSGKYLVPKQQVLQALLDWANSGQLSSTIEWTTEIL